VTVGGQGRGTERPRPETPFERLWRTGDLGPWLELLHPDVVLRSPITSASLVGVDLARDLYDVLRSVLADVEVAGPFVGPDGDVYVWQATAAGRPVEGCDLFRTNDEGRITEVTVFVRPATGVAALAAAMSGPLAARRRPRARRVAATAARAVLTMAALLDAGAAFVARAPRAHHGGRAGM
jgi:hypothetical protein